MIFSPFPDQEIDSIQTTNNHATGQQLRTTVIHKKNFSSFHLHKSHGGKEEKFLQRRGVEASIWMTRQTKRCVAARLRLELARILSTIDF